MKFKEHLFILVYKQHFMFSFSNVCLGPFAETMKRYKMTASFFGICGIIAVPGLISTGQAPILSVALGKEDDD